MSFGYGYWVVYLPAFNQDSFLLLVHNPVRQLISQIKFECEVDLRLAEWDAPKCEIRAFGTGT